MSEKSLEKLYKDLEKYHKFDKDDYIEKFLNTMQFIITKKDSNAITILMKYLDDESEYEWIQQSIIHAIESFDDETYVPIILKNFSLLFDRATEWLIDMIKRIINNHNCLNVFRKNMYLADKESLLKLFDIMEKESPHHRELIKELRAELDKSKNYG